MTQTTPKTRTTLPPSALLTPSGIVIGDYRGGDGSPATGDHPYDLHNVIRVENCWHERGGSPSDNPWL